MRPGARTGSPETRVQRAFDSRRLASDCQARAYEWVLPIVRRPLPTAAEPPADVVSEQIQPSNQGGMAA
jgi:hypothetical protein